MKCQILSFGKNKEHIGLSFAEFAHTMVSVNYVMFIVINVDLLVSLLLLLAFFASK